MNKNFLKEIKSSLKEKMKLMQFKTNGQSYIRVINKQIYQALNFQDSVNGNEFTINLAIKPICGLKVSSYTPNIRIGFLIYNKDKWWNYSVESLNEVVKIINEQVLPLFDKLSSYITLYEEIKLEINDIPRSEKDWNSNKVKILYNIEPENLFWIAFRMKEYEKCQIILKKQEKEILEWLDKSLESVNDSINNTQSKKYIKIFEDYKKQYKDTAEKNIQNIVNLNNLIKNNQYETLLEITNEIEEENLKTFEKYII